MRIHFHHVIAGLALVAGTAGIVSLNGTSAFAATGVVNVPPPSIDTPSAAKSETAVFAGGCFWGVQGVFQHVNGVRSAVSGYAGGARNTAQYETVSTGTTGHAESVRVTWDPTKVSYGTLLRVYFSVVTDPTMLNAQGPDEGPQYRSVLFTTTPQQAAVAKSYIAQLGKARAWSRPIVTAVEPYRSFFPAESYHQDYLTLHPEAGYIRVNDLPKVAALRQAFPTLYRAKPVLVRDGAS